MPENPDRPGGNTPAANPRGSVRFGPFTLDLARSQALAWRGAVPLPSRALEALAYLIAHRDRVVEKDEIIAAVWHDVAVTDDSLIHAVSVHPPGAWRRPRAGIVHRDHSAPRLSVHWRRRAGRRRRPGRASDAARCRSRCRRRRRTVRRRRSWRLAACRPLGIVVASAAIGR